jgi:hypothetical protein
VKLERRIARLEGQTEAEIPVGLVMIYFAPGQEAAPEIADAERQANAINAIFEALPGAEHSSEKPLLSPIIIQSTMSHEERLKLLK